MTITPSTPVPSTTAPWSDLEAGLLTIRVSNTGNIARIRRATAGGQVIEIGAHTPGAHDQMVGGIFLRRITAAGVEYAPLTGSGSASQFRAGAGHASWSGAALGLATTVELSLDPAGGMWVYRVELTPLTGERAVAAGTYDVVAAQDLGLAPPGAVRANELYTSHYLAHRAIGTESSGWMLATRQTMALAPALPLLVMGIVEGARGYLTDAFDLYGLESRVDGRAHALLAPEWDSRVLQYETATAALLSRELAPGQPHVLHIAFAVLPDWRGDLRAAHKAFPDLAARAVALAAAAHETPAATGADSPAVAVDPRSMLAGAPLLAGRDLEEGELAALASPPDGVVRPERDGAGHLLSFFTRDARHVVAGRKERATERSHGHILRSGSDAFPSSNILCATVYAGGVFASHVVVGNTNAHRVVSVHRHPLNLLRSSGIRLLVDDGGGPRLLGTPSALVLDLGQVTWVYETGLGRIVVTATAAIDGGVIDLRASASRPLDMTFTVDLDTDVSDWHAETSDDGAGVVVTPAPSSGIAAHHPALAYVFASPTGTFADDGALWSDGATRDPALLVLTQGAATDARLVIAADVDDADAARTRARDAVTRTWDAAEQARAHHRYVAGFLRDLELDQDGPLGEFATLLPWFAHNALIHYLAPHGLEQFSGAAWGTRDACQGPLELLLAFRHDAAARDILERVFAHQFEDGDFPQWFMFDEYADVYQEESPGDVAVWPLIALAQYLETTGDAGFLDELVPFRSRATRGAVDAGATVADHVERILDHIDHHVVPGTRLYAYGDGDWDDTLQPAQASMRRDMVSSWTIALLHQSLTSLAATAAVARRPELAGRMTALAAEAEHGFRAHLLRDGVLAGFVHFANGMVRPIIHPTDTTTGISYRLIPMSQSILAGILTGEEAARHERLIRDHLHYEDGVRLMDRPAPFDDGRTTYFRRAEQSAFVGREVGLMYAHAHIRYAEAMAALGRPTAAGELLRLSPVGLNDRIPNGLPRQRNCYFSSSDAVFPDRYEAAEHWEELRDGSVPVAGGWRVYSSGPGIYLRVLLQHVLGVSVRAADIVFDALLPADCPELTFAMEVAGRRRTIRLVREDGRDGVVVEADGVALASTPVPGANRARGAAVALLDIAEADTLTVRHGNPGRTSD